MKSILALTLLLVGSMTPALGVESAVGEKLRLQEMFNQIRAQTKWNIDGDMLWGYFFTAPDAGALDAPSKELKKAGYRIVSIYPADDKSVHWLHVEKVETHSVESLQKRGVELRMLASKYESVEYDGMDVGPAK